MLSLRKRALTLISWLGFAALIALLLLNWAKFAYNGYLSLLFTGEVDYGEGIVWQQAVLIPGPRMYGDVQQYPFLVFHYPPLYHLVVHGLAALGLPWLFAGRLVSMIGFVALAGLAGALVMRTAQSMAPAPSTRVTLAGVAVTALVFATLEPAQMWARTMRVDLLAYALEFLGMYLGLQSLRRPNLIFPAVLAFVFAGFTKQTVVLGGVATFAVLLLHSPRRALVGAAVGGAIGVLIFAVLTVATHGGFPQHTIFYNVNRYNLATAFEFLLKAKVFSTYPGYLLLAVLSAGAILLRLFRDGLRKASPGLIMILLYFALSTVSLVTLGKLGSNTNYLIPWVIAWALLTGIAVIETASLMERRAQPLPLMAVVTVLIVQALAAPKFGPTRLTDPAYRREYAELVDISRRTTKPILSENMTLLMEIGQEVPWEPAIMSELVLKGLFDERRLVDMVEKRAFAFIVAGGAPGEPLPAGHYTPALRAAIAERYPVERPIAAMRLLMPPVDN